MGRGDAMNKAIFLACLIGFAGYVYIGAEFVARVKGI